MVSRNSAITAAQQAGNAPMWSGSTTCCATTSPLAFIRAQEASWDSRTIVEKPVRNSEFCISCTMPESEAFTTSRSTASMCIDYQILPFVHAGSLAGIDDSGAVELIEDRGAAQGKPHIEPLALVHRAIDRFAVHA